MSYIVLKPDELYHYGILGQKWGIRRFQNPDGTLTAEGRERYELDSRHTRFINDFVDPESRDRSPKPYQSIKPSTTISYQEANAYWESILDNFGSTSLDDIFK